MIHKPIVPSMPLAIARPKPATELLAWSGKVEDALTRASYIAKLRIAMLDADLNLR